MIKQKWFSHIERPSRYLGNEINAIKKDPENTEVTIALAFPDVYEVGMSHLGLKILYHLLNSCEWLAAETVFSPWVDLENELRERRFPLTTLESGRPLSDFDIVGFSLQHELSFTNVLSMLHMGGIPLLSEDRDAAFPLIIAGGPACFNPEPVASFFDAILIGDGEEATLQICQRIREAKQAGVKRKQEILHDLISIRGVYVPSFFTINYSPDGTVSTIKPTVNGYERVQKAIVADINRYPFPSRLKVPFAELVHDRLAIEISRGCMRGCRFCQAGMIYRPTRERDPELVLATVKKALRLTGFEELSLLSLSSGDYCSIGPLLNELMDRASEEKTAISLPSLRVDSLDPAWFDQIKRVRKTGFTLAPEAGNDRLRRVINKSLTNEEILDTARAIYGAGWNLIKLYFMIGLPGEDDKDLEDIIRLAREVVRFAKSSGNKAKLNVSLATFVPKSHTPFMWMPQISLEESRRRIRLIQNGLKGKLVRVKWNQPEQSWLEGIFSRGDRRLTQALRGAWQMGARFDAWAEHFKIDIWKEAFNRVGVDPEFYLHRPRHLEEVLPWDHLEAGVNKSYLRKEWQRSQREKVTPDCREGCLECGVCDHKGIDPVIFRDWTPTASRQIHSATLRTNPVKKYRITFCKLDGARHLSHLELVRLFIRAFRRAGLHFVYSKGFHPMPKISFAAALPVGTESMHETMDIQIYETTPMSSTMEEINEQLPPGIRVRQLKDITYKKKAASLKESHFRITMNGLQLEKTNLQQFLKSEYFPIMRSNKGKQQIINARPMVKSMIFDSPNRLNLEIIHTPGPSLKPIDIIKGVFHLSGRDTGGIRILKTRQILD